MYPVAVILHLPEIGATTTDICGACPVYQVVFLSLAGSANTLQGHPEFANSPLNHVNSQTIWALLEVVFKLEIFGNEKRTLKSKYFFDVHCAVHRNIISIVKPTRCTNLSNLFYFETTLYMFRTVFPSIIRSSRLHTATGIVKQILLCAS